MSPSNGSLSRVTVLSHILGLLSFSLPVPTHKLRLVNAERVEGYAAACTLELSYQNPQNLAQTSACDFLPHDRKCDVYFKICISTADGTEDCDVFSHTTQVYLEQSSVDITGEKAIIAFLSEPVPPAVNITITAMDDDGITADDVIGIFDAKVVALKNSPNFVMVPLTKRGRQIAKLSLKMKFQCMKNYYGQHCEVYCESDSYSYRCSSSGQRICMEGFFGKYCNETLHCTRQPCRPGALCVANLYGRRCICNGGDYPECYPPDDPCSESPCQNNGLCMKTDDRALGFVCQCPPFWFGNFCEKHISPCALAEQAESRAREYSSSTRNRSVCLNGGLCIDHPTQFDYFCKCPEGWSGDRCEQRVESNNATVTATITVCVLCLVLLVIGVAVYWCKRKNWKKRVEVLSAQQGFVYEPVQSGPNDGSELYFRRVSLPNSSSRRWNGRASRAVSNQSEYEKIYRDPGSMADVPSTKQPHDNSPANTASTAGPATAYDREKRPLPERPPDGPVLT
ncbi:calcium ion binding [Sparganum proliferum]